MSADYIHASCEGVVKRRTAKALGIKLDGLREGDAVDIWLPLSQIASVCIPGPGPVEPSEVRLGDKIESIEIPAWLATAKGLLEVDDVAERPAPAPAEDTPTEPTPEEYGLPPDGEYPF